MTPHPSPDVLIIGAGPAGCTLAYLLAEAGLTVTVLDRNAGPAFKLGESLLPEGIRLCREIGLGTALEQGPFLDKLGAQFVLTEDGACDRFCFAEALRAERGSIAYEVKRQDFDALLIENAREAGVDVRFSTAVDRVDFSADDHVLVTSREGLAIQTGFLVDASGQSHHLASQLGLMEPLTGLGKVALYSHFDGVPRDDGDRMGDIKILWCRSGWFWVIPFADGSTSVGVSGDPEMIHAAGSNDQERFDELCSQTKTHVAQFADREQLLPLRRAADYSYRCRAKIGDRFLMVGDASGFIDPIFSTGVFLAQAGAFLARDALVEPLTAGELPDENARRCFEDTLDLGVRRYTGLVRQFYNDKFMDNIIRSRRREYTRRALTSILAGDIFHEDNTILRMGLLEG